MQEYEILIKSDDDTINEAKWILEWQKLLDEASIKFGKRLNVAEMQKQYMIDAGFVDVQDDIYKVCADLVDRLVALEEVTRVDIAVKVPSGSWPKDRKLKEIAMYQLEHVVASVEPFSLALFTRALGWSVDKTQVLMAGVKDDFRNRKNHLYTTSHFVYGKKPAANV
jgi:dGTP triphosphohydrolase